MIGTVIGNFEVTRRLGKGGMGEVWLALHKEIKTKVAIKTLLPQISADTQQVRRFFNEAVAVSKIKHAGITKIFDVGFLATGEAYLAMEYLEGESLAARIARVRRLPAAELADVTRQIASVLEATHAEDITHRDLKPDNLFLVADAELARGERVKVLDFGIAKLSSGAGITGSGALGTPLYMSPEQWKTPASVDGRADVYSLGCIVFEMATGRPPYVAASIGEACTMHLTEPVPSLRARGVALPAAIDAIVQRMLAKTPGERPSLREVRAAFAELEATAAAEPIAIASTLPNGSGSASADSANAPPVSPAASTVATGAGASIPNVTTLGSAASMVGAKSPATAARTRVLIGGAAVLAVGAIGWTVIRHTAEPSAASSARVAAARPDGSSVPAAPAEVPAGSAAAAAQPSSIRVRLVATPATAEVRIDDALVANPLDAVFPRDEVEHHVAITARGYRTRAELVTFAADRTLAYALVPDASEHAVPAKAQPTTDVPAQTGHTIYHGTKGSLITTDPGGNR